jgi:hypothetical protein
VHDLDLTAFVDDGGVVVAALAMAADDAALDD